jgi:hypothetical protein
LYRNCEWKIFFFASPTIEIVNQNWISVVINLHFLTYYTYFCVKYIDYIYKHFNSLGRPSYFHDSCLLIFVHNGKRSTFVFCEQMTLFLLTTCGVYLCARGSRIVEILGIILCELSLPQSVFVWYLTGRHVCPSTTCFLPRMPSWVPWNTISGFY